MRISVRQYASLRTPSSPSHGAWFSCSFNVIPFVLNAIILKLALVFLMGYLGDCYTVRSQQTSIQLLQHLEVFKRCEDIGVMILHRQECTVGTHRRRLQQSITGDSCSVDQRAWLSNALVGQCNVTNPTQLLALTDVQTQNCCTYAMSLVDQHCFEPCKGEEGQQSISTEQFGLASFWVAYCEVEYNCNSNTEVMKKLPGNYSLASVPNIGGVEEEVLEGEDEDEDEEGMATAVLTAAAQSQLYALASVRASQQESYDQTESQDDNRYEALSQLLVSQLDWNNIKPSRT
eukprot:TRINITY_DN5924_c0_g1_i1.p1 TRINITY_DN5924_c0_g1~~TRINITY_DN5924_c0_g1_i1.p1  ORF type:complete len:289 (-),score=26.36 TRINITY_DN5924_c0_g1_i1:16-882(-)